MDRFLKPGETTETITPEELKKRQQEWQLNRQFFMKLSNMVEKVNGLQAMSALDMEQIRAE